MFNICKYSEKQTIDWNFRSTFSSNLVQLGRAAIIIIEWERLAVNELS